MIERPLRGLDTDAHQAQSTPGRGESQLRWECPRCGVDLSELVLTGKIVVTREASDQKAPGLEEEQVRCPSCERLVKPEKFD